MGKKEILIAGAGISGLVAARSLRRAGLDVHIIEARERTGGRISSIRRQSGAVMEAGPEFIHGHLKETIALLKEYHIPFSETAGSMYYARSGRFTEEQENNGDRDILIREMKAVKTDLPFMEFLLKHFSSEKYRKLRESAMRFAGGFDLADVHTVSTISLAREWEREEDSVQYRIPEGYGRLTDALSGEFISSGGKIYTGQPVNRIEWARNEINIATTAGRKFHSNKLLITLPVGVLTYMQEGIYAVCFSPDIPAKRAALQQIGFGTVIKIVLRWQNPFWNAFIPNAAFIISEKDIPVWWTQHPTASCILTGWAGGPAAQNLSGLSDSGLLDIALENLSGIFGIPVKELKAQLAEAKIFNWEKEIFTRGAYSFSLASAEEARAVWRSPLENTVYFAGEACYDGPYIGTVEAAIISGRKAAAEIIKEYASG